MTVKRVFFIGTKYLFCGLLHRFGNWLMRNLQANLRERAAACRSASSHAVRPEHRWLFDIVAELWSALADDCAMFSASQLAEEIQEVGAIHADVMAATKRTLH
jgi:hypothetical protein